MSDTDQDKPEEIEARMLGGLKRALKTPRKSHKPVKSAKPDKAR